MAKWQEKDRGKVGLHVLVVVFGITSWSIMNGLWVELPILVPHLPEGWTLPSYLTIVSQFGNLGPVLFSVASCLAPHRKLETGASLMVVTALTLCGLFFGLFWKETASIDGEERSIALLSLTFLQATFASTTSLTYLAFMSHLKARYMSALFVGMGLSGLIPAFAALAQGSGDVRCVPNNASSGYSNKSENGLFGNISTDNQMHQEEKEPAFTVRAFFLLLSAVGVLSLLSLLTLIYHPYCRTEHVDKDLEENCKLMDGQRDHKKLKEAAPTSQLNAPSHPSISPTPQNSPEVQRTHEKGDNELHSNESPGISTILSLGSGTEPGSLFSPSSTHNSHQGNSPDGSSEFEREKTFREIPKPKDDFTDKSNEDFNKAMSWNISEEEKSHGRNPEDILNQTEPQSGKWESWYLLFLLVWINLFQTSYVLAIQVYSSLPYGLYFYNAVTKAENIVDPIACLACLFVQARTSRTISGLTLLGTLFTAYIITMAAMSPHPFLERDDSSVGGVLVLIAWVMCTILMVFSKVSIAGVMRTQGRTSLIWTGGSTQMGAFIGAVLAYVMINHLGLFKDGALC